MTLAGKVAVVTGGSRGIGRAISMRLARDGAEVILTYQQNSEAAEEVVRAITEAGGRAHTLSVDGGDLDEIHSFFAQVDALSPHLDILVNNVGTATQGPKPLGTMDAVEYDRIFSLNTRGLFFTTQEALTRMRDGGRIVNVSSVASRVVAPGRSVYAGTKGAVEAFTRVWAAELGARGITVNSVSPGTVETERLQAQLTPEMRQSFIEKTPLARIGQPEDIADIVAFLCSEDGRWLTAQNLLASGGMG